MVFTVAFSADGHRIMAVSPMQTTSSMPDVTNPSAEVVTASSVQVWDTDTGQLAGPALTGRSGRLGELAADWNDHPPISAAAISPDGLRIVVSTVGGLRLYEIGDGKQIGEPWLVDFASMVLAVSFTADGRYVAVAHGSPGVIQIVDAQSGRRIGPPLRGHTGLIYGLMVGADDRTIATGAREGWMNWPGPAAWRDTLCDKLADGMTADEWKQWVSPTIPRMSTCPGGSN
jgi:WD40 repeat protein